VPNYMKIDLFASELHPFGPNIHLVYQLSTGAIIYMDPDYSDILSDEPDVNVSDLFKSGIFEEDAAELNRTYQKIIQAEYSGIFKLRLHTPSGVRWFEICPLLAGYNGNRVILCTLKNTTAEVEQTEVIARYANKKNSILHMLAHDLRGPLNIANSVLKSIDLRQDVEVLHKKTGYIAEILEQSIELIADLVNREMLETAEVVLLKKRVDIVKKVKEYLAECKRSEILAQRSFSLTSSAEVILIEIDEAKFMQVINNLLANSLKFTNPHGKIHLDINEKEREVHFTFSDNGIGIPQTDLSVIFDKFSRARRTGLNGEASVGLGLSIVKTIIDWHKGRVWCESNVEQGTAFHITLPKI
jgi:two-component system sensor histidine kinase VicK